MRRELPSEVTEQIAKEEGSLELDPAALADAVEEKMTLEQHTRARMAEQLKPQQEAIRGLLDELEVDPEGKTPREVGDEVEEKVSGFMTKLGGAGRGKFGKTVKTVVLAAMVLGVAAGVATAGETGEGGYKMEDEDQPEEGEDETESIEATEEIATEEQEETEPADLDKEAVVEIIKGYANELGEVEGLTQAEGNALVDAMVRAGEASTQTHGLESRYRGLCDKMVEYTKYILENEESPSQLRLEQLRYGLDQMANEIGFRSVVHTELGEEGSVTSEPVAPETEATEQAKEATYEPITLEVEKYDGDISVEWMRDNVDKVFEKDGKILVIKEATSQNGTIAKDKARLYARGEMAKFLGGIRTPDGSELYDTDISESSVVKESIQKENGRWRAVVLMEIPVTERAETDTTK